MIFNLLVFLFIVMIALFFATQGMLSAFLALVTATFSSLLAMALTEVLEPHVGKMIPLEFARGVTFFAVFLLTFAITRVAADLLVPKNIRVKLIVNRVMGGVIGFFAAMIVVGSVIIGIEFMPLPTTLMGYDRFPGANMQGSSEGTVARQSGVWFSPDRFTLAVWSAASGRGLGGSDTRNFSMVHPDLSVESYGFRRNMQYASKRTVPPEHFEVPSVWTSADPKDLKELGIEVGAGQRAVVARAVITKGEKSDRTAADSDETYFRVTPSEVRLVTNDGKQYYPIGYLEGGKILVKTDLETGQIVDDFVKNRVVEDWVFMIGEGERPALLEVKQTARKELAEVKEKPAPALARGEYPQKPYLKDRSSLLVGVTGLDAIQEGKVYVMRPTTTQKEVSSELRAARDNVLAILSKMDEGKEGWSNAGKPGIPNRDFFNSANNKSINLVNKNTTDTVEWQEVLNLILAGQFQSDPAPSITSLSTYVKETLVPLFAKISTGNPVLASADLKDGKANLDAIPKGNAIVLVTARTEKGYYIWISPQEFTRGEKDVTLEPSGPLCIKAEKQQ